MLFGWGKGQDSKCVMFRSNTTGYRCSVFETVTAGYCGHYSSTKVTDQSSFHMPKVVDGRQCMLAAKTGIMNIDGKDHKVGLKRK